MPWPGPPWVTSSGRLPEHGPHLVDVLRHPREQLVDGREPQGRPQPCDELERDVLVVQGEVGAVEHVRLDPALPAMRALGVSTLAALARGAIDMGSAEERVVTLTRQYAKRQETFFRNRMAEWTRLEPNGALDAILGTLVTR